MSSAVHQLEFIKVHKARSPFLVDSCRQLRKNCVHVQYPIKDDAAHFGLSENSGTLIWLENL